MESQLLEARPAEPGENEHAVRFYERDEQLLEEVAEYLDEALRGGGLAVAIATPQHRAELSRRLCGFGPLQSASGWFTGSLVLLDAAETLERFMVDGSPDAQRFEATLSPVLAQGPASSPSTRLWAAHTWRNARARLGEANRRCG